MPSERDNKIAQVEAQSLLCNSELFEITSQKMVDAWPFAAEANLTNRSRNRQAWIGQATCCFAYGSAEHQTKEAWHQLTSQEQAAANLAADKVISHWESIYA